MDKRYCYVNAEKLISLRQAKGWNQEELASKAGLDIGVIQRAESGKRIQVQNRALIEQALEVEKGQLLDPDHPNEEESVDQNEGYTWQEIMEGAKVVADKAFHEWGADLVLSFPGPSSLFAGLVTTMLPIGDIVRNKMFMGIFVKGKMQKPPAGFEKVSASGFTILVPQTLLRDPSKKIVVIDDSITSGGTMEALRRFFRRKKYDLQNVQFACCVCYDGLHAMPGVKAPEIVGIPEEEVHRGFEMPWEKKSFTFEQAIAIAPTLSQFSDLPEIHQS